VHPCIGASVLKGVFGSRLPYVRYFRGVFPQGNEVVPEETRSPYRNDPDALKAEHERLNYQAHYKFAAAVVGQNKRSYEKLSSISSDKS
jgi:hypothetical protein